MRGLRSVSPEFAERLSRAIPQAFDRLIDAAIRKRVDFVVLAGDIFDQAQPSYANFMQFIEGLRRLGEAGILVYMLTGNHDPYTRWRGDFADLPANVYMFPADKPGFVVHHRDGEPLVLLGGRGYYNHVVSDASDISEGITREAARQACGTDAPFAVGVLHTGLHLDPVKAPSDPAKLLRSGFDYWALGHIHHSYVDSQENPRLVFSGCIQGRDIRESGARGCYLVTLEQGQPNRLDFIPLASIAWQMARIDVSDCATLSECHGAIMRELFRLNGLAQCEEMAERITLSGSTDLHATLAQPGVLEDLRKRINEEYPIFYCDALIDRTMPALDREALVKEGLFPSVVLGHSAGLIGDEIAAVAYLEEEFLNQGLTLPVSCVRGIGELQKQAEIEALDMLRGAKND